MYHLSVKPISRSSGRSATAAAAYRAGEEIVDERTGEVHDYSRKGGVEHSEIVLPPGSPSWAVDRAALWNAAEAAERRKDARVAREYEVAIPKELTREQGIALVRDFAGDLVDRYGVAVDFAIHRDHREKWDGSEKGFEAFHAHVLASTRELGRGGFGEKASPELSDTKRKSLGMVDGAQELERSRERWEIVANRHLEMAGESQRIDRRSLKDQGIDREPTRHLGPIVTALERRGIETDTGDVNRRIEMAFLQGVKERAELTSLQPQVIELGTSIADAVRARDAMKAPGPAPAAKVALSDRPPEQIELAYEVVHKKLAQARRDKVNRVQLKAEVRHARRDKALRGLGKDRPAAPTGLLAGFKRKSFEQASAVWERTVSGAQSLVEQAHRLRLRLSEASKVPRALEWAEEALRDAHPELVRRFEEIQLEKSGREAERQAERQAGKTGPDQSGQKTQDLSLDLSKNRDRDRGLDGMER